MLLASLCFAAPAQSADTAQTSSSSAPWITPNDDDLRLVEVRYKSYVLAKTIIIYESTGGALVPLNEMSNILDIAIKIDLANGVAQGFVFDESRTFHLDVKRKKITLGGEESSYPEGDVHFFEEDIYIDSKLIGSWLKMVFDVDFFGGVLFLKSENVLPFEAKLEREKQIKKMKGRYSKRDFKYELVDQPYGGLHMPAVDQTMRFTHSRFGSLNSSLNISYTGFMTAEILKMQGSLYADASNTQGLDNFRWKLGRFYPEPTLLGAAKAREFTIGNISSMNIPMIMRSGAFGYGGMISNYPRERQIQFDSQNFEGDLLPGWEVELYHNNSLVGYQQSRGDGRYQFIDVPLFFGSNYFRLKFYGPQGQVREENRQFLLGRSLTLPKQQYYRAMYNYEPEFEEHRAAVQYEVGINRKVSAAARAAMLPINGEPHAYFSAGIRSFYGPAFFQSDLTVDAMGGFGLEFGSQTRFGQVNFKFRHAEVRGLVSDSYTAFAQPLIRSEHLGVHTAIPASKWTYRMPISLEMNYYQHEDDYTRYELFNRFSMNMFGAYLSHHLKYIGSSLGAGERTGLLLVSRRIGFLGLRSEVNYDYVDGFNPREMSFGVDGQLFKNYRYRVGVSKEILRDAYEFSVGLNGKFHDQTIRLDASTSTDERVSVSAAIGMGSAFEPRNKEWAYSSSPVADLGLVSMRTFIDKNQNGEFDFGDEPIKGVGFHINGYPRYEFSDENGVSFLRRMPVNDFVQVGIREDTLEDPLWVPQKSGVKFLARPGKVMQFDFPINMTGEIDGITFVKRNGAEREIGEVKLQLLNEGGTVVQTTTSAYDGFYIFTRVPVGKYRVRVDPEQVGRLKLKRPKDVKLEINAEDVFLSAKDFILELK